MKPAELLNERKTCKDEIKKLKDRLYPLEKLSCRQRIAHLKIIKNSDLKFTGRDNSKILR